MAGKADDAAGQLARRQLEAGVVAQISELVCILIAAGDRQDPGLQDVGNTMDDTALVAGIGNATGEASGNAHRAVRLRRQQNTAIRCQSLTVERRCHILAANGCEPKTGNAIVDHGGRGTFCPGIESGVNSLSLRQISKLIYARQPRMARLMNNPG